MEKQRHTLLKSLAGVKGQADKLLEHWTEIEEQAGNQFFKDKLSKLAQRQAELETGIAEVDEALRQVSEYEVDTDIIRNALVDIDKVYAELKPFGRRDLMASVLKSASANEREIVLEIYAMCERKQEVAKSVNHGEKVRTALNWLPELVAQSVLRDAFPCHLPSLIIAHRHETRNRIAEGPTEVSARWQHLLATGEVKNRAELARRVGVSRARITQVLARGLCK